MSRTKNAFILCTAVFCLSLTACGGGASQPQQQKTAVITFSTVSSAHTSPLMGIQLTAKLPPGATISNLATALSGHNDIGQVVPGTYSAANQTVTLAVIPTSGATSIKFGTFADLTCDVTPGVTLTQDSFTSLNTPFPDLQVTGLNGVDLSQQIPVKIEKVTFGF